MVHGRKLGAWWKLATFLSVSRVSTQCNGVSCAWLIPSTAIVLRGVKCNDVIADYGKDTLYSVVDLGRKKFAKVFVVPYGLQGAPGEAMSSQKYLHTSKAIAV